MHRPAFAGLLLLLPALLAAPAAADEHPGGDGVAWRRDLPAALEAAKASGRVVMICVNARFVEGRTTEEPAAKGLREVVYRDPKVVERSRDFECVFLTPEGTATEYAPLRALGIEGVITSPQHIFLSSGGDRILLRRAYWSHGKGEEAVRALLALMDEAIAAAAGKAPAPAAEVPGAPADGEARAKWIAGNLEKVRAGEDRDAILAAMVREDRGGDCTGTLVALLEEEKKDTALLVSLVRALGRDGLEAAALPIADLLGHRDDAVRGNAAVSLEYIGCREEKVITALSKFAAKERDEAIANHAWRALGRCGSKNPRVAAQLLAEAGSAKSEFASYGPFIGLSYFEGDKTAMRGVEKLLKQIGVPGGKRGGGGDTVKRGLVSWTLASIGDHQSAKFLREEMLDGLKNVRAFWVEGLRGFWENCAAACDGQQGALERVEGGVGGFVRFARGGDLGRYGAETRSVTDEYRKGRDMTKFKPRGEGLLDDERQ